MKNRNIAKFRVQYHEAQGESISLKPCPVCGAAVLIVDSDEERIWEIRGRDQDSTWNTDEYEASNFLNDGPGAGTGANLRKRYRKTCFRDFKKDTRTLRTGKKVRYPIPEGHRVLVRKYPENCFP